MALKLCRVFLAGLVIISSCSPLLRGDGPETWASCCVVCAWLRLAVPSYGAMALKHVTANAEQYRETLAVPSYGAMALKLTERKK